MRFGTRARTIVGAAVAGFVIPKCECCVVAVDVPSWADQWDQRSGELDSSTLPTACSSGLSSGFAELSVKTQLLHILTG